MQRRDLLKRIGGSAALLGAGVTPVTSQAETAHAELGEYTEPWDPADSEIPGRRNVVPMPDDYFVPGRFAGKTVIVTGCARGMGRGAAWRLAREGANVVGVDWLAEQGRATMEAIAAEGYATRFVAGDVGQDETCAQMVEIAVKAFGKLDRVALAAVHRMEFIPARPSTTTHSETSYSPQSTKRPRRTGITCSVPT